MNSKLSTSIYNKILVKSGYYYDEINEIRDKKMKELEEKYNRKKLDIWEIYFLDMIKYHVQFKPKYDDIILKNNEIIILHNYDQYMWLKVLENNKFIDKIKQILPEFDTLKLYIKKTYKSEYFYDKTWVITLTCILLPEYLN